MRLREGLDLSVTMLGDMNDKIMCGHMNNQPAYIQPKNNFIYS